MIDEMEKGKAAMARKSGKLTFDEFQQLYADLKAKDVALSFKTHVSKRENLQTLGGMSEASSDGECAQRHTGFAHTETESNLYRNSLFAVINDGLS